MTDEAQESPLVAAALERMAHAVLLGAQDAGWTLLDLEWPSAEWVWREARDLIAGHLRKLESPANFDEDLVFRLSRSVFRRNPPNRDPLNVHQW